MRSWTPKGLRIFSPASKLHHAPLKPTFDIRKHISPTPKDARNNAAHYKHKASRLVKEVKEFARSQLPVAKDTAAKQEQQPQDLVRKIIFGADTDDNIAAYEQRHQRFLEGSKSGGSMRSEGLQASRTIGTTQLLRKQKYHTRSRTANLRFTAEDHSSPRQNL